MNALSEFIPSVTNSPAETVELGATLAGFLEPGDIVALYGELGTGKTHFVKGISKGLGGQESAVSSPTFTIIQEYGGGAVPLYHFDAYRIKKTDDFFELGYDDYFFSDGICVIEWPERVEELLPPRTIRLHLEHAGPHTRRVSLLPVGPGAP